MNRMPVSDCPKSRIWMVFGWRSRTGGARLGLEALDGLRIGRATSGFEQLDRHLGVELQVIGAIDPAHRPDADQLGDVVLADAAWCPL